MKTYGATFLKRDKWWVAWSEDVPGALTQGRTLVEARANLKDAIRLMRQPVDLDALPTGPIGRLAKGAAPGPDLAYDP